MARKIFFVSCFLLLLPLVAAYPWHEIRASSSVSNAGSSLTLLYQNNLNASDDVNHIGAILLDSMSSTQGAAACATLSETLLSQDALKAHQSDFVEALSYIAYAGRAATNQSYYISNGVVAVAESIGELTFPSAPLGNISLPVLCTQSSQASQPANSTAEATNELTVTSGSNTFVGYRNQKSFRFLGIPYANPPTRFQYTNVYSGTYQTIQATAYGSECAQAIDVGSEDCLFLNIQTPYIPKAGSSSNLRPVMYWIHGGGFTSGTGADPLSDGGNLASREDIVVVTINYRLSTLGFLAIPGTNVTGNYGIADQIVGLQWTIDNIASFGGDPTKITIVGESAGAGSVRTLLGSAPAIGKFQGGIAMSNLGGGVALGLSSDYATTYSSYLTIAGSYALAGQEIFIEAGCNQTSLSAQIACISTYPALNLVGLDTVARYVVQDGTYVNTEQLIVSENNASTAHVPVMFGNMANDGASFSTYPTTPVTSELAGIEASLSISSSYAESIISSDLFPFYSTGNLTLDSFNVTQRVATDLQFRCIYQATVYAGIFTSTFPTAYYYQMNRGIGGYDPNGLGGPPATPEYPLSDPNLPYFKFHASDMAFTFGNLDEIRDPDDLYFAQLVSGYWAEFVKSGQPNPQEAYLKVRGYAKTLQQSGSWNPVVSSADSDDVIAMQQLNYPPLQSRFLDLPQCSFLNYSLTYYLSSDRG